MDAEFIIRTTQSMDDIVLYRKNIYEVLWIIWA